MDPESSHKKAIVGSEKAMRMISSNTHHFAFGGTTVLIGRRRVVGSDAGGHLGSGPGPRAALNTPRKYLLPRPPNPNAVGDPATMRSK